MPEPTKIPLLSNTFSVTTLLQSMRSLLHHSTATFNRLPPTARISLSIAIPAGLMGGYIFYQKQQLAASALRIERFRLDILEEVGGWQVWQIEDRLYSMSDVMPLELTHHRGISFKISRRMEALGRLREEVARFKLLANLESYQTYLPWRTAQAEPKAGSLAHLHQQLDSLGAALTVTDSVNHTLSYLKRRLYPSARSAAQTTLKQLHDNHLSSGIGDFSLHALYGQAHNLAAKVARMQDDYAGSDAHYSQAIEQLQQDEAAAQGLSRVQGSQIALWTDFDWFITKAEETSKIKSFIDHPETLQAIVNRFLAERYSLGLANVSWMLIKAVQTLNLSIEQAKDSLQQAQALASYAINFMPQPQRTGFSHAEDPQQTSSNAWLFRGIARMEQVELDTRLQTSSLETKSAVPAQLSAAQRQTYQAALQDFEAGLMQPNAQAHPSLLRRRALVLEKLGKTAQAYNAYRDAQREFRYRLANQGLVGPQAKWLLEIELAIETLRPQVTVNTAHEAIIDHIVSGDYQASYQQMLILPSEDAWGEQQRIWFNRHFRVDTTTGQVTPCAREALLEQLGLQNAPSPYVCMALSMATYHAKHQGNSAGLGAPSGWQALYTSHQLLPNSRKSGYLAVAFQHIGTQQLIISHGGTDASDPKDLQTDFTLAWGKEYAQLKDAQEFTKAVIQGILAARDHEECQAREQGGAEDVLNVFPTTIYHTGHSLGGALAAYLACTSAPIGSHYAITFDNPSSHWQITHRLYQTPNVSWYKNPSDFPVTNYLTRPTFLNCAGGPHLGRVIRLQLDPVQAQSLQQLLSTEFVSRATQWIKAYLATKGVSLTATTSMAQWLTIARANLACHDGQLILNAFGDNDRPGQQYRSTPYYALAWPRDLDQWRKFEQSMMTSHPTAKAVLDYLPTDEPSPEAKATATDSYSLRSSQWGVTEQSPFRESIPLVAFESELAKLLKELLKDGPILTPKSLQERLDANTLSPEHQHLAKYLDSYVLSCLQLNPRQDTLMIKGALSSWQLFTYLRQQVQEACQQPQSTATLGGTLYPSLEHLPGLMQPPKPLPMPTVSTPYTIDASSTSASLPTSLDEKKSTQSRCSYGTFFPSTDSLQIEAKHTDRDPCLLKTQNSQQQLSQGPQVTATLAKKT